MRETSADFVDTKQKILEAAGKIFAARGFQNATVREICKEAGVNVAAINSHFRDKKSLYFDTLRYWHAAAFQKYPHLREADASLPPESRLRAFVIQFMGRMLNEGKATWFGKLMAKEVIEPTEGLDIVVEEAVRPCFGILRSIVAELIGDETDEGTIRLCAASTIGQCLYFFYAQPVIAKLFPCGIQDLAKTDVIADHVARFSVNAIKAFALQRKGGKS
jgi:TetR/AcrR family transcriptional regulator, regulator of cefoperazone and chloramphenicol sensitivity